MVDFWRAICVDPLVTSQREWLVSNGMGAFACGLYPLSLLAATTSEWEMRISKMENGLQIIPGENSSPFSILSRRNTFISQHRWVKGYLLAVEQYRDFTKLEDHLYCADYWVNLQPGVSTTVMACPGLQTDLGCGCFTQAWGITELLRAWVETMS